MLAALITVVLPVAVAAQVVPQADAELERVRADFQAAVETFGTIIEQPDSIPMFSRLISELQAREGVAYRDLLADSLLYRARAQFNNGADAAAADDVRELLRVDSGVQIDRVELSPRFVELFDAIFHQTIGYLEVSVSPDDAQVQLDGEPFAVGSFSFPLVAGAHTISLTRPGYRSVEEQIDVAVGDSTFVDRQLVRLSAVARVLTRPSGARVAVDGVFLEVTEGESPPDFVPPGGEAVYPRSEFSAELFVEGLQPGRHVIDVTLDGYRPTRYEIDVADLADYVVAVVLEQAAGAVVLEGLSADAQVRVDGVVVTPESSGRDAPRLLLEPGDHAIEVSQVSGGVFAANVTVADRRTERLQVQMGTGLAFLGVLGGDDRGARDLADLLTGTLGEAEGWSVLDRTFASPVFDSLQLTTDVLRAAAASGVGGPDWATVQSTFDSEAPGSVYMLAVLNDDLLATHADLWIWSAAPAPPQPDRVRVRLDGDADVAKLAAGFEVSTFLFGPWFGALLVDVGDRVTVVSVGPGGPAETAGLAVGDHVVAVGGQEVARALAARRVIAAALPGTPLPVQVQRGAGTQVLEVTVGVSPRVISPSDPELVYSVISASLGAELEATSGNVPSWIVKLNQAAVLVHAGAWEETVRMLRSIEDAPSGPGLGQATVEYWLGIALTALGPTYRESAIDAFRRAAADPDARLFHNDGPWVAPRANARLAELGGGQ